MGSKYTLDSITIEMLCMMLVRDADKHGKLAAVNRIPMESYRSGMVGRYPWLKIDLSFTWYLSCGEHLSSVKVEL